MKQALAISNLDGVQLSLTTEFHIVKDRAIAQARLVSEVIDHPTMETAVAAASNIAGILKALENSRVAVKAPVLKLGRAIDAKAKEAAIELAKESARLNEQVKAYYREMERKADAARRLAEKLAQAKREKAEAEARAADADRRRLEAEAARAKSDEEASRLRAEAEERERQSAIAKARAEEVQAKEISAPEKADNMTVRKVWKHEVTDLAALYKARPELVALEPRTNEINRAVRADGLRECPGLRIWQETDTTIRS